jgi:hypothetical protein
MEVDSPADFTIKVKGLPAQEKEEAIQKYFNEKIKKETGENNAVVKINLAYHVHEYSDQLTIVKKNLKVYTKTMGRIHMIEDELKYKTLRRSSIETAKLPKFDSDKKKLSEKVRVGQSRLVEMKIQFDRESILLEKIVQKIVHERLEGHFTGVAYVTFRRQEHKEKV